MGWYGDTHTRIYTHIHTHTQSQLSPKQPTNGSSCFRAGLQAGLSAHFAPISTSLQTGAFQQPLSGTGGLPQALLLKPFSSQQPMDRQRGGALITLSSAFQQAALAKQHKSECVLVFQARGNGSPARFPTVS